jgi:hypothetical protein
VRPGGEKRITDLNNRCKTTHGARLAIAVTLLFYADIGHMDQKPNFAVMFNILMDYQNINIL